MLAAIALVASACGNGSGGGEVFLEAVPRSAAARLVQGIDPADIAAYIGALTPVVLRADTRVTNHGFKNGRATPHQSVLQAGTAVLVDDHGVPRVRCFCGNPLLPPKATKSRPTYAGQAWTDFDPGSVQVVAPSEEPLTEITLVDLVTGETFTEKVDPPGVTDTDTSTTTTTSSITGDEITTTTTAGSGESTTTVKSATTTTTATTRPTTTTTTRPTTTTTACGGGAGPCSTTTTAAPAPAPPPPG